LKAPDSNFPVIFPLLYATIKSHPSKKNVKMNAMSLNVQISENRVFSCGVEQLPSSPAIISPTLISRYTEGKRTPYKQQL